MIKMITGGRLKRQIVYNLSFTDINLKIENHTFIEEKHVLTEVMKFIFLFWGYKDFAIKIFCLLSIELCLRACSFYAARLVTFVQNSLNTLQLNTRRVNNSVVHKLRSVHLCFKNYKVQHPIVFIIKIISIRRVLSLFISKCRKV